MQSWVRASVQAAWLLVVGAACGGDGGPTTNGNNGEVTLTARHGHVMVYDEARRQLLLFGGTGAEGTSPTGDRNSTWAWNGSAWTRVATSGPSPRYLAAVTYDAARQRVVLHGGQSGVFPNITYLADTWEWDGASWSQRATAGPSARVHQTMAFDRARGRVVLYGGFTPETNAELNDIWEWDGTAWRQSSLSGPANSVALGIAYDEKTAALYLYSRAKTGGALAASRSDGTALTTVAGAAPPCIPIPRQFAALGVNPGGFLLYTHTCDPTGVPTQPQSWRWDGAAWTRVNGTQPPLRFNAAMAYDRDRNRVVLYGGEVAAGTPDLADTWDFDGAAWTRR
jgi:hypothetical protein